MAGIIRCVLCQVNEVKGDTSLQRCDECIAKSLSIPPLPMSHLIGLPFLPQHSKPREEKKGIIITLDESDIKDMGWVGANGNEYDGCNFRFEDKGVSVVLLKKLIKALGYQVIEERDFEWPDGHCDWEVVTTYPYSRI